MYIHINISLSLRLYVSVQLCACMCMDASMRACVQREDLPRYNRHASEFAADIAEAWCDLILCYHIKNTVYCSGAVLFCLRIFVSDPAG